jgi:hypothetical protein
MAFSINSFFCLFLKSPFNSLHRLRPSVHLLLVFEFWSLNKHTKVFLRTGISFSTYIARIEYQIRDCHQIISS